MAKIQSIELYTEQEGIVVSKEYIEAKEERTDMTGKVWPASDEKFKVKVVSCTPTKFSKETGMKNPQFLTFETDKETFAKIKFETWMKAKVGFTIKTYGDNTTLLPEFFALIEK